MTSKTRSKVRGFTLIELVIVIAVIAILAALLVPTILGQAEKARLSRAAGEVNEIGKAFARMRTDTGSKTAGCYVAANLTVATAAGATNCGVATLCNQAKAGDLCWGGPYMTTTVTNDPWNKQYDVQYDTTTASVRVKTTGPNGVDNTCAPDDICKTF